MFKKINGLILFISIISIFTILCLSSFVPFANAQVINPTQQINEFTDMWSHTWYAEPNPFSWYNKVYNPNTLENEIFGERYTAAQVQWVMYSVIFIPFNFIPGFPELATYCLQGEVLKCTETIDKIIDGLNPIVEVPTQNIGIATIIKNNPISGIGYITRIVSKFSIVSPAYAQGFGYNTAADAFISMWQITRNISYGFIVIAAIILAFMVMFRIKINPQTMVSVQIAIPRVVSALILITFSYAIAGLLIDLMYVFIGLLAMFITSSGLSDMSIVELFNDITTRNAFALLYSYWVHFVAAAFMTAFSGSGMGILVFIIAILSILVILWWSLKIIMMIVKNFALLVITIIAGPLEIMLGAVTQSTGFNTWFKKMVAYLAFYPVLAIMFFLAFFFLNQGDNVAASFATTVPFHPAKNIITNNSWEPPLSFLSVSGFRLIWILVSFFIFSEITKVAEIVQSFISGKQWAYGSGIGEVQKSVGDVAARPVIEMAGKGIKGAGSAAGTAIAAGIKALINGG